jgi:hypothetical protein
MGKGFTAGLAALMPGITTHNEHVVPSNSPRRPVHARRALRGYVRRGPSADTVSLVQTDIVATDNKSLWSRATLAATTVLL